jgi:hypothetical protein
MLAARYPASPLRSPPSSQSGRAAFAAIDNSRHGHASKELCLHTVNNPGRAVLINGAPSAEFVRLAKSASAWTNLSAECAVRVLWAEASGAARSRGCCATGLADGRAQQPAPMITAANGLRLTHRANQARAVPSGAAHRPTPGDPAFHRLLPDGCRDLSRAECERALGTHVHGAHKA